MSGSVTPSDPIKKNARIAVEIKYFTQRARLHAANEACESGDRTFPCFNDWVVLRSARRQPHAFRDDRIIDRRELVHASSNDIPCQR